MNMQPVLDQLSNFYKDFINDDQFIQDLFNIYDDAITMATDYLSQIERNLVNNKIETYRTIPYMSFSADQATYTLKDILSNPNSTEYFLNVSLPTYSERVEYWNNSATISEQIKLLTASGFYVPLNPFNGDVDGSKNAIVIDAEVTRRNGDSLINNVDYVISNNNFYMLLYSESNVLNNYIIMNNIIIDYNVPYIRLGSFLEMPYKSIISKPEYKNISLAFLNAAIMGPKIKNIKYAMNSMFSNFKIYDMYSPNNPKKGVWDDGTLSQFDFLIDVPPDYSGDADKIDLFYDYLDIIKPPDSSFFVNFVEASASDTGTPDKMKLVDDANLQLNTPDNNDIISMSDSTIFSNIGRPTVENIVAANTRYDLNSYTFDSGLVEDPGISDYTILPSGNGVLSESCDIHYITFPEFPVGITVSSVFPNATISFTNNCTGVLNYEIYRNDIKITTITPTIPGNGTTITYIDNNLSTGDYAYYIKAVYAPFKTDSTITFSANSLTVSSHIVE